MKGQIFETKIGKRTVTVETGKYLMQTNGACFVKCEGTVVMVNATMSESPRPGIDYFPLGVDYEEKMYSVGRIPGGFKRREGRAADKAILTARLIDRPLRPLFPKGFFNDVSVVATVLSVNPEVSPEPLAMLGSSIALSISDIPFEGPTGSVIVGLVDGKYVINPTPAQMEESLIDLALAGTKDAVMMVEAGSKEVTEKQMLDAILFGHKEIKKLVKFQNKIVKEVGKPKTTKVDFYELPADIDKEVREYATEKYTKALYEFDRVVRKENEEVVTADVKEYMAEKYPDAKDLNKHIGNVLYAMKKEIIRGRILTDGVRPDGRDLTEVRPIWCEVGILPRVHGTAVFTRGLTQSLTTLTLGTMRDAQKLDGLDEETEKRYMHHYNFPGYSVGESRPMRGPGRREIGHGSLAERALVPVLPSVEEFPYSIRTVSEIMSSNGSTSQASICGSTLSMMDGGVPLKAPVAGIAMGLIQDKKTKKVAVLTDIQGLEDFLGDMDFKVAGTPKGITAIQMDIKIDGINEKILTEALEQARVGRAHILGEMLKELPEVRENLSEFAPKITSFNINPDKIRDVIGKGGETINKIIEDTGVKIDIDDEGVVFIATTDAEMAAKATAIIKSIALDPEPGQKFTGEVVRIMDFGAFVNIAPGKDGMVHISKLSKERVNKVTDVVNLKDKVEVEVIKIDQKGRIDLKLVKKL